MACVITKLRIQVTLIHEHRKQFFFCQIRNASLGMKKKENNFFMSNQKTSYILGNHSRSPRSPVYFNWEIPIIAYSNFNVFHISLCKLLNKFCSIFKHFCPPQNKICALDSRASGPGLSPGQGHCVVFLGKTLYSQSASLHPGA